MQRTSPLLFRSAQSRYENLIQIRDGTFYVQHPAAEQAVTRSANPPLFRNLTFELPATTQEDGSKRRKKPHWAIIGTSGATKFLEILRGSHVCLPPDARSYPYLSSAEIEKKDHRLRIPSRAIQYVGFNGGKGQGFDSGVRGAYLSARYESRREETDWSVLQYLKGETDLNPAEEKEGKDPDDKLLNKVVQDLRLEKLLDMPVSNLSNGQTRRSRIARALLGKPELLLLDEPFMGLDPPTLVTLSPILRNLAYRSSPLLLLALRPQDPIPDWITHLAVLGTNNTIALMGEKAQVLFSLHRWADVYNSKSSQVLAVKMASKMTEAYGPPLREVGHTLTSKGIVRYTAYERAKQARSPRYFNRNGEVFSRGFAQDQQDKIAEILDIPDDEKTLEDWLFLTSKAPENIYPDKNFSSTSDFHSSNALTGVESTSLEGQNKENRALGEALIELRSVIVKYGDKTVLGYPPPQPGFEEPGLNLTIRRGTRLALLGPNGSGKTTLLSLLTSDHPHSYSLPIQFFGRSRLPQVGKPGLSLWEIQSRIGHSSPEVHSFFPRGLTIRKVLESAWAETYGAKPTLTWERDEKVDAFLRWWEPELRQIWSGVEAPKQLPAQVIARREWIKSLPQDLDRAVRTKIVRDSRTTPPHMTHDIWKMLQRSYPPLISTSSSQSRSEEFDEDLEPAVLGDDTSLDWADDTRNHVFGLLPFGTQRLLLLLRAMIKEPDILVLDEAFSGLSPEVREKAMCWLEHGENVFLQGRMVSSTVKDEDINITSLGPGTDETRATAEPTGSNTKGPRGRPQTAIAKRPSIQPGRPPGRPLGSLKIEGPSPWMSRLRQEEVLEGEKRWEIVKARNMRRAVERVCEAFDIEISELAKGRWKDRYRAVHECRWQELLEIARNGKSNIKGTASADSNDKDNDDDRWSSLGSEKSAAATVEEDEALRYRFRGLSDKQAMIVVSHVREEIPGVVDEWLRLPGEEEVIEHGKSVEMGRCDGGNIRTVEGWGRVWGL